jgi:hypothetical protein
MGTVATITLGPNYTDRIESTTDHIREIFSSLMRLHFALHLSQTLVASASDISAYACPGRSSQPYSFLVLFKSS